MFSAQTASTGRCVSARRVPGARRGRVCARAVNVDQLKSAKSELEALVKKASCAPILVRLAWHDSGTYNKDTGEGGATGTIRFDKEITAAPNAGLNTAIKLVSKIKKDHPDVTWADLYQLGSAVSIEVAGGPKIDMQYGRIDGNEDQVGDTSGLPAGDSPFPKDDTPGAHLRAVFGRMGFSDQEIVALSGAHTLGRAFKNRSGAARKDPTEYTKDGPGTKGGQSWTPEWLKFDNSYFKEVKEQMDPELLVLQTDDVLFRDESFATHANKYAEDNDAFLADYAAAHKKLSELGVCWDEGAPVKID